MYANGQGHYFKRTFNLNLAFHTNVKLGSTALCKYLNTSFIHAQVTNW